MRRFPTLCAALWLWATAPFPSPAALPTSGAELPAPGRLLESAREGRSAFLRALSDLERLTPTLTDSASTFAYLRLLDALESVGEGYELESWGADPLQNAARVLATHAARWINLGGEDWSLVETFLRRANDETRYNVVELQTLHLSRSNGIEAIDAWMRNLTRILALLAELDAAPFVRLQFEELEAKILRKAIDLGSNLDDAPIRRLIENTSGIQGLGQWGHFLDDQARLVRDPEGLRRLMGWAVVLHRRLQTQDDLVVPTYLAQTPGDVILILLVRRLTLGAAPEAAFADVLSDVLTRTQHMRLVDNLLGIPRALLRPTQTEFLWRVATGSLDLYRELGLTATYRHLRELIGFLAGRRILAGGGLEGTYRVAGGGREGYLTLADTGEGSFIAGIHGPFGESPRLPGDYPFFLVSYDPDAGLFEAHRFASSSPRYVVSDAAAFFLRFRIEPRDGLPLIRARFTAGHRIWELRGRRVERYAPYRGSGLARTDPTGVYRGTLDHKRAGRLTLSRAGNQITATLLLDRYRTRVDFNYGVYDPVRGVFYLTSGDHGSQTNWVQLRGRLTAGGIEAEYIIGGRGKKGFRARRLGDERLGGDLPPADDEALSASGPRLARLGED